MRWFAYAAALSWTGCAQLGGIDERIYVEGANDAGVVDAASSDGDDEAGQSIDVPGGAAGAPAAIVDKDGNEAWVVLGRDERIHIHHRAKWEVLGDGPVASSPSVTILPDGRIVTFTTDGQGALLWIARRLDGTWEEKWRRASIGGGGTPGVVSRRDGQLVVAVRLRDGSVGVLRQASADLSFGEVERLDGLTLSDPVVGRNLDGRLEVFAIDADNRIGHRWETGEPGPFVADWYHMGNSLVSVRLTTDAEGRIVLLARNREGGVWWTRQVQPNRNFADPEIIHRGASAAVVAMKHANGQLFFALRRLDGGVDVLASGGRGTPSKWWESATPISDDTPALLGVGEDVVLLLRHGERLKRLSLPTR